MHFQTTSTTKVAMSNPVLPNLFGLPHPTEMNNNIGTHRILL